MDVFTVFGFLAVGLILIGISNYFSLGLGEASKASMLLAPIFMYLIGSGKLAELEGVGWKAKFNAIASVSVGDVATASELMISEERANEPNYLLEMIERPCREYYVLEEGLVSTAPTKEERETVLRIARAVRVSMLCGVFEAIVVVDGKFKPVGVLEARSLQEILRIRLTSRNLAMVTPGFDVVTDDPFSEVIASEFGLALTNPAFQANSIIAKKVIVTSATSIEHTYSALLEGKARVAAITDRAGHFEGIVTRPVIESWILSRLLAEGT